MDMETPPCAVTAVGKTSFWLVGAVVSTVTLPFNDCKPREVIVFPALSTMESLLPITISGDGNVTVPFLSASTL